DCSGTATRAEPREESTRASRRYPGRCDSNARFARNFSPRRLESLLLVARHGSIAADRSGGGAPRRVAPHGVLLDSRGASADGVDANGDAARDRRVGGAGAAATAGQTPSRWRFRYSPLREIPSALATRSTRP